MASENGRKTARRGGMDEDARANGRDRKSGKVEDRRGQLLKIAARMFAELGFEATTVRMISKEAGMLSGSLYHHFGTKEEILHKILEHSIQDMAELTTRISQMDDDPEAKLIALVILYMNRLFEDYEAFAILYNDRRFFHRHPDFAYVSEAGRKMFANWCVVMEEGQRAGLFRADLEHFMVPSTIIRMLSTSGDWFMHQTDSALPSTGPFEQSQVMDFNIDVVLRIVRAPDRIKELPGRDKAERLIAASMA